MSTESCDETERVVDEVIQRTQNRQDNNDEPTEDEHGSEEDDSASSSSSGRNAPHEKEDEEAEAKRIFTELCGNVRLPALDQLVLKKYLLCSDPSESAESKKQRHQLLLATIDALHDHKRATMDVLRSIHQREATFVRISKVATAFEQGDINTMEAQALALRELYILQSDTLQSVQAIIRWRGRLTRPFAFLYQGNNYIVRIIRQMHTLELSSLGKALSLSFSKYPLMSNVPSLPLFKETAAVATYPLKRHFRAAATPVGPKQLAQLQGGEEYIKAELNSQLHLCREMLMLCKAGKFLPILHLPDVVQPEGGLSGVLLRSAEWLDKVRTSIELQIHAMMYPDGEPSDSDEEGEDDEDMEAHGGPEEQEEPVEEAQQEQQQQNQEEDDNNDQTQIHRRTEGDHPLDAPGSDGDTAATAQWTPDSMEEDESQQAKSQQ